MSGFLKARAFYLLKETLAESAIEVVLIFAGGHLVPIDMLLDDSPDEEMLSASYYGRPVFLDPKLVLGFERVIKEGHEEFETRFDDEEWTEAFVALRAAADASSDPIVVEAAAALDAIEAGKMAAAQAQAEGAES